MGIEIQVSSDDDRQELENLINAIGWLRFSGNVPRGHVEEVIAREMALWPKAED